jgi:hypothetical protein
LGAYGLSTHDQIMEVFDGDVALKSRVVAGQKWGKTKFLQGLGTEGWHEQRLYEGILSREDESLLRRMASRDRRDA